VSAERRELLAVAIFAACWRMYEGQYRHSGPTPEIAWGHLDPDQRKLFLFYADAAVQFLLKS
jgi:hypothetical protein